MLPQHIIGPPLHTRNARHISLAASLLRLFRIDSSVNGTPLAISFRVVTEGAIVWPPFQSVRMSGSGLRMTGRRTARVGAGAQLA